MNLQLDTHILIWWFFESSKLSSRYIRLLTEVEKKGGPLTISVFSLWEIAKLVEQGKIALDFSLDQWFEEMQESPLIEILPLTPRIILESTRLGTAFHKDPADQLIVATARCHEMKLMTVDEKIKSSGVVAIA